MAMLPNTDRLNLGRSFCEDISNNRETFSVLKPDFRDAVEAIDAWVDANASSFNQAIPQPARSLMTENQKARLLMAVVRRRAEVT